MATTASVYSALLKRFRSKEDDFLSRLVTVDETWVHYYEPESMARVSEAKEVQNATLCCQGDGNCILGCTRLYYVGLFSKEKYNNSCVLCGRHFRSNEEVVVAVEEWVRDKDSGFFSSGLTALEHRWSKCIILEGNYIEKEEIDLTQK